MSLFFSSEGRLLRTVGSDKQKLHWANWVVQMCLQDTGSSTTASPLRIGTSVIHMPGSIEYQQVSEHNYQRWQRDWPRDQCVTLAQVCTGHSPLVAAYLHRIERRDSAICPHCHSADETVEHLVFQCPAHDHARRDTWPGDTFTTDLRRLWSYLERIGVVTRPLPPTGNERERERVYWYRAVVRGLVRDSKSGEVLE